VPVYYMPQLQLLMEILDLDTCDFIQYKPADITWPGPAEFVVVHVPRDRQWFQDNLPIMKDLWDKIIWHRANGCDDILPKTRTPRKIVEKEPIVLKCEIEDDEENNSD